MERGPWIIAITGSPGAGKSTTAAALAQMLGAAVLDQDSMTNALVDVVAKQVGTRDYEDPRLAALVRGPRYDSLIRVAGDCAAAGVSSVLVAPFTTERRDAAAWDTLAERIKALGGTPLMVWLRISAEDLAARLSTRGAERDTDKLADVSAWVRSLDLAPPAAPAVTVDAMLPPAQQAAEILDGMEGRRRGDQVSRVK